MAYDYSTSTGIITADTSSVKTEVEAEVIDVLGLPSGAEIDSSGLAGRLVDMLTNERVTIVNFLAYCVNQFNPDYSDEWFFDSLYKLLGGERDAATYSTATCELTGVASTLIPSGSYVQDSLNQQWISQDDITLDSSGEGSGTFQAVDSGAVSADSGTITTIISAVTGWETVTNSDSATEGSEEQSLVSGKLQRVKTIGANSRSVAASVVSAVLELDGVESCAFRENRLDEAQTIDNLTMPANSSWLCVDGGVAADIAEVYCVKTWGTQFYGQSETVTADFTDSISTQTQTVTFDRPTDVPMLISVTATIAGGSGSTDQIKEAVQAYADGEIDGYDGFALGKQVSPFQIASALSQYFSPTKIFITEVQVSTVDDNSLGTDTISLDLWEKASIDDGNISVTVNT